MDRSSALIPIDVERRGDAEWVRINMEKLEVDQVDLKIGLAPNFNFGGKENSERELKENH